ncbi:MAG: alpha/beta fold hydrolase [Gaiellaceae bacterium]
MHVRVYGEGPSGVDAVPLVLLHLSPLSGRIFETIAPLLAAQRAVVVPDRLGFGDSDRLVAPLEFEEYGLATLDALDALGVDVFDVVGIHTGSCEAIELAVTNPDRVRRASVVALPVFTDEELAEYREEFFEPPEPSADGAHLDWVWSWWKVWQAKQPGWDLALMHKRVVDHMDSWPNFWWTYHAVFEYPTAERLAQVRQPFLVLAPHDDLWTQTQHGRPFLPPQARFLELPHLSLEIFTLAADEIAAHIEEFLA